jgi:hypothetical protein
VFQAVGLRRDQRDHSLAIPLMVEISNDTRQVTEVCCST